MYIVCIKRINEEQTIYSLHSTGSNTWMDGHVNIYLERILIREYEKLRSFIFLFFN